MIPRPKPVLALLLALGQSATTDPLLSADFESGATAAAQSEQLSKITVNGLPAIVGTKVLVLSDAASGSLVDVDGDGMADGWEGTHFGNTSRNGTGDFDNDGLPDLAEFNAGTDPTSADSDGDLLSDSRELDDTSTDPLDPDSDGDSVPDGLEIANNTLPDDDTSKIDRPNIIFILCDDLGYGDLGVLFQNTKAGKRHLTPHLDTVAAQGMILNQHYCPAAVCAPSRASLFSGVHQGHATVRNNQFDDALEHNHSLASTLRAAGYATSIIGKWGLQGDGNSPATWTAFPTKRGFDFFYGYVTHGAGHNHYPAHSNNGQGQKDVYDNNLEVSADLSKCYTTDLFTARAKKLIIDEVGDGDQQPFFLCLAYDTPHAILQLPTQAYPAGGGISGGLQWNGTPGNMINTASGTIDSWRHPDYTTAVSNAWTDVEERFATSVRRIDDCVGDLRQTLAELGITDDTLIIFTSDNGPHEEDYLNTSQTYDGSSYKPTSFDSYGPFEGIKRDCWEGGVREPTLAVWPGNTSPGQVNNSPSQFHDWMATFTELAGWPRPARTDGVSLAPTLTGTVGQQPSTVYIEYYNGSNTPNYADFTNHGGQTRGQEQALFLDGYKGVRNNISSHATNFRIYDIAADPKEGTDLAGTSAYFTELGQRMKDRVLQLRQPERDDPFDSSSDIVNTRPYDSELVPPVSASVATGIDWAAYEGLWPWLPEFTGLTPVSTGTQPTPDLSNLSRPNDAGLLLGGFLSIPADGLWSFHAQSDSGVHLRIHDSQVIDDDFNHDGSEVTGTIRLQAGLHPFRLYYRTALATPALALEWSGPGTARSAIPAASLYHTAPPPPDPVAAADSATTANGAAVLIDVLANDLDDGLPAPLSITAAGKPLGGTSTIQSGMILYTPDPGFFGSDTFTYTITDANSTAAAAVTINSVYQDSTLWLPLNETSGGTIYDAGGVYIGNMTGFADPDAAHVPGVHGRGLSFDGTDDEISLSGSPTLPTGNAPRTVMCWVRVPAGQANENQTMFGYGLNSNGRRFTFRLNGSAGSPAVQELRLEVQGGNIIGTTNVADGSWHHVAAVIPDGASNVNQTLLYVDGRLETISGGTAQTLNTAAGTTPLLGGSNHATGYNFLGAIDEFRFFPSALSQSEIQAEVDATSQVAAAWHTRYLGAAAIDWSADIDGEGIERLLEHALGGNPHIPDRSILPTLSLVAGRMHLSFPRRVAGTHDLIYTIQTSEDLVSWGPATTSVFDTSPSTAPDFADVILDVGDATELREFIRLQVQLAP